MYLTDSRYALPVQYLVGRNAHEAMRWYNWLRLQHPDLIIFASGSSEYSMNVQANSDYSRLYSASSITEFQDWLERQRPHLGLPRYATLAAFNSAFGLSTPAWNRATADDGGLEHDNELGKYWNLWQTFPHQPNAKNSRAANDMARGSRRSAG